MPIPVFGPGTSQWVRDFPSLREGYFNVDEMTFEELLAQAADYSKLLRFYNLDNEPDGNWNPFFLSDEAVVMAQIMTTDLVKVESDFRKWLARNAGVFDREKNLGEIDVSELPIFDLAKQLDGWLNQFQRRQLSASETGGSKRLSDSIQDSIESKLASELLSLVTFLKQFDVDVDQLIRGQLSDIWFRGSRSGVDALDTPRLTDDDQQADRIEQFFIQIFYSFYHSISSLKTDSRGLMSGSLENGAHDPAAAMYIAFAKLFKRAQDKINLFTERHLDFYYNDVLKARYKKSVPDSTYLLLRPDIESRKVLINRGREFLAGTDEENQDIIFTADTNVLVHGARVSDLRTLYLERDSEKSPEHELGFATNAMTNRIAVLPEDTLIGEGESRALPLFGAPQEYVDDDFSHHADIGFALASPLLLLGQGQRNISIKFKINYIAFTPFRVEDFNSPANLAVRLRDEPDPVSTYLRGKLSSSTQNLLKECDGVTASDALTNALIVEFDAICLDEPLYEVEEIKGGKWKDEIQKLIEQNSQVEATGRINRLILEMVYPDELKEGRYLDYLLWKLNGIMRSNSGSDKSVSFSSKEDAFLEDAFFKLFGNMFSISLTTESGWHEIAEYSPQSQIVFDGFDEDVLKIQIRLPAEVDPIVPYSAEVHRGDFDTDLPVIRFLINPSSYLYPYDFLRNSTIDEIELSVNVEGVRDVLLYNNLGQLDPNSPFNPFGPLPSVGDYLIVGNREIARKKITALDVNIEWAGLPVGTGGFSEYYKAYEASFSESSYSASIAVLNDGRWLPYEGPSQSKVKLFNEVETYKRIDARQRANNVRWSVGGDVTKYFKPLQSVSEYDGFAYGSGSRNGFFRFTLASPEYAFGHEEYPRHLTAALTENARLKNLRKFRPLPNPPYTPLIKSISVDYQAESVINFRMAQNPERSAFGEKMFLIHPFGSENAWTGRSKNIFLVPEYVTTGNLFIGLSARDMSGPITLFFHLREDFSPKAGEKSTNTTWSYLSSNVWQSLADDCVISDTTDGFLSSGIVTLNVPDTINLGNTVMPENLFWLKVSVHDHPEYLGSVYSVHAHALKVTRRLQRDDDPALRNNLPAGTIKESRISIPGIDQIHQVVGSFGGSPPESAARAKIRLSERLRHKNRALVSWDYERLILERFPEIFMVKCFSNVAVQPEVSRRPGHIMIVVIPYPKEHSVNQRPIVNGLALREISEYVKNLSSPFATIAVKNASYEQIQVRCAVKFAEGAEAGYNVRILNRAITDCLSPWNLAVGYGARFNWCIRRQEIEAFILRLPYVEFVTDVSILHIAVGDNNYHHLFDSAAGSQGQDEIRSKFPGSIAIPMRDHFIEVTNKTNAIQPQLTGIAELRIGSTLIATDSTAYAQPEIKVVEEFKIGSTPITTGRGDHAKPN